MYVVNKIEVEPYVKSLFVFESEFAFGNLIYQFLSQGWQILVKLSLMLTYYTYHTLIVVSGAKANFWDNP